MITLHGRPAGMLIGFAWEDDWFDYRLEHHPEFLRRIEAILDDSSCFDVLLAPAPQVNTTMQPAIGAHRFV